MSITDELREWGRATLMRSHLLKMETIADRIDAEHQKALDERDSAYDAGYAEGMGVANKADMRAEYLRGKNDGYDEGWDAAAKTMTERMVELPKDADGVPIHFGDVLDQFGTPMTVLAMSDPDPDQGDCMLKLTTDGISDVTWVRARKMRHYHAPTVEDVLTEFGIDWEHESDCEDRAALLKEYAAKLRLAKEDA